MSEEQTPPSPALRLKPRLRPAVDGDPKATPTPGAEGLSVGSVPLTPVEPPKAEPAAPAVPPPVLFVPAQPPPPPEIPANAAPGEAVKFKFKPKAPQPAEVSAPAAPVPVAPAVPAVSPAIPTVGSAVVPAVISAAPAPVLSVPVPAVVGAPPSKTVPPFPTAAPVRTGTTIPPLPVPHLVAQPGVVEEPDTTERPIETPSRRRRPLIIAAVVIGVGLLAVSGWQYFQVKRVETENARAAALAASTAAEKAAAKAAAKAATPSPVPSDTLTKIAQAPANVIDDAQNAIEAQRATKQARVDAAVEGKDAPDRPAPKAPSAAVKAAPTMTSVAPGVTTAAAIEAGTDASAEFRLFVANVKIKGVFQGNPARAMINGRLMRAGERIDADLGIIFEGLNPDRHQIIFTDRSGAKIYRKY